MLTSPTLTQRQIDSVKEGLAASEKRLISEITDQEVWDAINLELELCNKGAKEEDKITWHQAMDRLTDDWGTAAYLGYI